VRATARALTAAAQDPRRRVLDAILANAARRAGAAWRRILDRATPGLTERLGRRLVLASA
jgi:hypothetical protein